MTDVINNKRDYRFDNIKAVLIFLTVFGHALELITGSTSIDAVNNFIYSFHMPVFIFITGYFSKNTKKCHATAVKRYLLPYLIFTMLLRIEVNYFAGNTEYFLKILKPSFGLWFFLAVFWWKYFLDDLIKIRYILPLSIVLGTLCSFNSEFSSFLTIGRTINFSFFFLLGYYVKKEHIEKVRKIHGMAAVIPILLIGVFSYLFTFRFDFPVEYLFFRDPFKEGKALEVIAVRLCIYLLATGMIMTFIRLSSNKKKWYTYIGTNSVSVYVIHLFIIKAIEHYVKLGSNNTFNFILMFFISGLITILTALPLIEHCYQKAISFFTHCVFKNGTPVRI